MQSLAVVLADDARRRSPGLERLRHALVETLHALGVRVIRTGIDQLSHYLGRVDSEGRIVLFAESPSTLAAARSMTSTDRRFAYSLLVAPTSFSGWGAATEEWASGLTIVPGEDTVYLTDSALSRTVLENHLSGARTDVRILLPRPGELDESSGVTFTDLARWRVGDSQPEYSGTTWDFAPRASHREALLATPEEDAERRRTNAEVLEPILTGRPLGGEPVHLGILGHKLTFIDELARDLARRTGSTVEMDEWKALSAPSDVPKTLGVIARSDVIIGEWGRPNNVWIQQRASRDKRLIVRVHRYEVTTDFPRAIDMDRFDAGVVIVPWVGRALAQWFDWPAEKLVYIPNYVNTRHFRRPKLPGSEFTLGIVGITPDLKRLDLALDLLAALRGEDLRYTLRVRGQLPPSHLHWSTNPAISEQWGTVLFRLRTDPLLRNAVFFDEPGRDMAAWLEGIGVMLSTSDLEGSHVALAEGAASGALPIVRPWPGARTLWPADVVHETLGEAVERILASRDETWRREALQRIGVHPSLDQDRVLRAWWDLVRGRREDAQAAFGPIDWTADLYEPVEL
ncbi:hypothetical protein [Brachybacterium sp. J153]|uniref:hypothetical protein n=1 Tax=Brachybacterium sp. J153 TaxID=3116488 RepID=UPI002E793CD0|nr:hypothetical protein [Brachybacterium sp. J153]MEE1617840.1 hypothetical protein [Brachybacterium sp. J153]